MERWPLPLRGQGKRGGPCPWAERWLREHPIVVRVRRASYSDDEWRDCQNGFKVRLKCNISDFGSLHPGSWICSWICCVFGTLNLVPGTWYLV